MLCEAMLRVQNALPKYRQIVPIRAAHTSDTDQVASGASLQVDGMPALAWVVLGLAPERTEILDRLLNVEEAFHQLEDRRAINRPFCMTVRRHVSCIAPAECRQCPSRKQLFQPEKVHY